MAVGDRQWQQLVVAAAGELGVVLSAAQASRMGLLAGELLAWNRRVNLTAITDPAQVALKHFADALAAANRLPLHARVLDVGTGAGFPGLALKIARPDLCLTLIDAVRKKISFVNHGIRLLGLAQTTARHVRLESLGREMPRPVFDVVVCRAVGTLSGWVAAAAALLSANGMILAYKGPLAGREIADLAGGPDAPAVLVAGGRSLAVTVQEYRLPVTGDRRALVQMSCLTDQTPD